MTWKCPQCHRTFRQVNQRHACGIGDPATLLKDRPPELAALVAHEDGLGPLWNTRRAFWQDRPRFEADLRKNFLSFETTRGRHVGTDPSVELYDPDLWNDEFAFLNRPGQDRIQVELFYDYRTNVASYPTWQKWLQKNQPKLLVLWGRYDPSFQTAEAEAYRRDVPSAQVKVLDAGHFALDTKLDEIAELINHFLDGGKI
jgi:pimeloyl-ACP methyl ester carboxylesterase